MTGQYIVGAVHHSVNNANCTFLREVLKYLLFSIYPTYFYLLFPHKLIQLGDLYDHRDQLRLDKRKVIGPAVPKFHWPTFRYAAKLYCMSLTKYDRKTLRSLLVDVFDPFHCRKILL